MKFTFLRQLMEFQVVCKEQKNKLLWKHKKWNLYLNYAKIDRNVSLKRIRVTATRIIKKFLNIVYKYIISIDAIIMLINYMIFFKCAIGHNSNAKVDLAGYVAT